MSLQDAIIIELVAPLFGGVGGLALACFLLSLADYLANLPSQE